MYLLITGRNKKFVVLLDDEALQAMKEGFCVPVDVEIGRAKYVLLISMEGRRFEVLAFDESK